MPRITRSALSLSAQIAKMREDFPDFTCHRQRDHRRKLLPTWRGVLQPLADSALYLVEISYRYDNQYSKSPRVWVKSPRLDSHAPHRYSDGSLCLYYPRDGSWTPYKYISETIVPWTALWLAFYEIWTTTGQWYGLEAPHRGRKRR